MLRKFHVHNSNGTSSVSSVIHRDLATSEIIFVENFAFCHFLGDKKIDSFIFISLSYLILSKIEKNQNQSIKKLFNSILAARQRNAEMDYLSKYVYSIGVLIDFIVM